MDFLGVVSASVAVLGAVATGIFAIINRKGGDRAQRRLHQEPSWAELVTENRNLREELSELSRRFDQFEDRVDRRDRAFTRILHDISAQWPEDVPNPSLNQGDLDVISDRLPWNWRWRSA